MIIRQPGDLVVTLRFISISALSTVALVSCLGSSTTTVHAGDFATAHDANQRLGTGINLGNMLEAPTEGAWGVQFKDQYAVAIRDAGFDHVRLPVKWSGHISADPPHAIDAEFLERVKHVVETCLEADLAVVLNVHHFDEIHPSPDENEAKLQSIWKQISTAFAGAPGELFLELLNEPQGNLTSERWNAMIPELVRIVREQHPKRPIVIGGASWNSHSELRNLRLPADDRMIIATFHYYLPFKFTHQGAPWTAPNVPPVGRSFPAEEGEMQEMAEHFAAAAKWSEENDRPLYVGEYGSFSAANQEDRVRWTQYVQSLIRQHSFSSAYWEFCSGFGAYDPRTDAWRDDLLRAIDPDASEAQR